MKARRGSKGRHHAHAGAPVRPAASGADPLPPGGPSPLLADYLRAYAGTPLLTEGNLPGGGRLFETCVRAVEPGEQLSFDEEAKGLR